MSEASIRKNLISNIYVHSRLDNFYRYAQAPKAVDLKKGNHPLFDIKKRMENLQKEAETLEQQFYDDIGVYGISKTQFEKMFFSNQLQKKKNTKQYTYREISAETARRLNKSKIGLYLAGIDEKKIRDDLLNILKNSNADITIQQDILKVFDQYFASNSFATKFAELFSSKANEKNIKSLNTIRAALLGRESATRLKSSFNKDKKVWGATQKTLEAEFRKYKKNQKGNSMINKDGHNRLVIEIRSEFEKVCKEYGITDLKLITEWKENFEKDFLEAAEEVIKKQIDKTQPNFTISTDVNKGTGDNLEIIVKIIEEGFFNNENIKVSMVGAETVIKKKTNTYADSYIDKPVQMRTDNIIEIKLPNGQIHSYGIQLKNTYLTDKAVMHVQPEIRLDTLLSTMQDQNLITQDTQDELYYLLANIFWFQHFNDTQKLYVQNDSRTGRSLDNDTVLNYANILLQSAINFIIEPQIGENLEFNGRYLYGNLQGVANVFFVYQKFLIPISWFYRGVIFFINSYIKGGKTKNNEIPYKIVQIKNISLKGDLKNPEATYNTNPIDLWLNKQNALLQEKEKFVLQRGMGNSKYQMYRYPPKLVAEGHKPGLSFAQKAKISGIYAFMDIAKLEEYYKRFRN